MRATLCAFLVLFVACHLHSVSGVNFEKEIDDAVKEIAEASSTPEEKDKLNEIVGPDKISKALQSITTALTIPTTTATKPEDKGVAGLDFSAANAKFAVGMAVGSLPKLIDGIKKNDWKNVLHGSLGIAASFLYFTGPWGAVAAAFLPILDSIFKLMDGSMPKIEESQEDLIDRVVSAAIERAQLKEFKMELAGVRRTYITLSESITAFRSSDKELSKEQANVLYNHAFDELVALGKLADLINTKCTIDVDANVKDDSVKQKVEDCLIFVDIYSDLSITRKLLILDMAALLKGKFDETTDNLIDMYKKEFKNDVELLRFLIDPVNFPTSRFIVATFYQQQHLHETTAFFLDALANAFPHKRSNGVLVCMEEALRGQCYQMTEGVKEVDEKERKENDMAGYSEKIQSLFIPLGLQVTAFHEKDKQDNDRAGPFVGMSVITTAMKNLWGSLPRQMWKNLAIEKTDKDAHDMVKICQYPNFNVYGLCDTVDIGEYVIYGYHGTKNMEYFGSMLIPNRRKVTLFDNDKKIDGVGPFYGPDSYRDISHPFKEALDTKFITEDSHALMKWTKIKVEEATPQENARHMVKMCTENNFSGRCFRVPIGQHPNIAELPPYKDFLADKRYEKLKKEFVIASIIIPTNVELTTFSGKNYQGILGGPYTGPVNLPQVKWEPIKSLKIQEAVSEKPLEKLPEIKDPKKGDETQIKKEGIDNVEAPTDDETKSNTKFNDSEGSSNVDISEKDSAEKETKSLENNSTESVESPTVKSAKEWNHEIRDESFREFIKDERPAKTEDSGMKRSASKNKGIPTNSLKVKAKNPKKVGALFNGKKLKHVNKNKMHDPEKEKHVSGSKKAIIQTVEVKEPMDDVFTADGMKDLKRRNKITARN